MIMKIFNLPIWLQFHNKWKVNKYEIIVLSLTGFYRKNRVAKVIGITILNFYFMLVWNSHIKDKIKIKFKHGQTQRYWPFLEPK